MPSLAWSMVDFWESGVMVSDILELTVKWSMIEQVDVNQRNTDYPCGLSQSCLRWLI